jgi:2-phosphosulfolactate phosphatase
VSLTQAPATVQLEWGETGALAVFAEGPLPVTAVVVDVLSFTTVVTVACERGSAVVPVASRDPAAADAATQRLGAVRAGLRGDGRVSLSPASLLRFDGGTVVVPAQNGATISEALSRAGAVVLAGCLRNAAAVAQTAAGVPGRILLVPAGELWPDDALRPALEDLLGAGAIAARLRATGADLSPEAAAAADLWDTTPDPVAAIHASASGRDLADRGFSEDLELATATDITTVVPRVDADGAFRARHA